MMLRPLNSANNSARTTRASRYLALALALFAMGGQLLSGLHFVLVQHVTCSEHGELIETGVVASQVTTADAVSAISALAVEGHGHDHCAIALLRRQQVDRSVGPAAPLRAAPPSRAFVLEDWAQPAAPIDLLSVAPKNSPPV